jgi:glycosyltransferase involved in cell wall biosynthesis
MRTLVVDALRLVGPRTGQGRHIEYLAQEWSRVEVPFDRVVLATPRSVELTGLGGTSEIVIETFGQRLPLAIWEQAALSLRARRAAVLFGPTYILPLAHRAPTVVAIHGIYERLADEFPRLQRLRATPLHRLSARRATRVIANSQQSKTDVVEFFGVRPEKIDVVYPAAHEVFFEPHDAADVNAEIERTFGEQTPYFIFVGKLSKRRHIPNLIEAFSRVRRELGLPHRLLIVGPNSRGYDINALAAASDANGYVVYRPHVEHRPLAFLYAGADAFILPTTYEGISQTMFEAMASGTPVLTVLHPPLEEGGADSVLAVPSPSVRDIGQGLKTLLDDDVLRRELSARGRARAAEFSWSNTAQETMAILDRVAAPFDR